MESTRLCHMCRGLQLNEALERLPDGGLMDLCSISLADFFKSASSCDICRLTARHLLEKASLAGASLEDEEEASIIVSIRKDANNRRLILFSKPGWHMVNWMVWTSKDALIDPNPLSDSSLDHVRSWIHECNRNHTHCKKPEPSFMPTRLLDVGVASSRPIRLVLSAGLPPAEDQYVALSHCWGKSKPLTTTSANISQFQVEIRPSSLPQTFADAVKVTQILGIRYLWIDSLCIIQDSQEDWLRESATMASVYSNADITISASRASSSIEGFLSPRHETCVSKEETDASGQTTSLLLVHRDYYDNSTSRAADSHPEPLSKRAWVIQERYLSRRKMLFGSAQIFWECNGMTRSEDTQLTIIHKQDESPRSSPSSWYDIVESFTDCDITYESDTLPAISGVAKTVAQGTGLTYCAGIWVNDSQLCNSLLWSPKRNGSYVFRKVKRNAYVAPSFSWAASQGPIWYRATSKGIMSGRLCKYVFHGQTLPTGSSNPYGAVENAFIMLNAPIIQVLRLIRGSGSDADLVVKLPSGTYSIPATFDHEEAKLPPDACILLLYSDESRMQALVLARVAYARIADKQECITFRRIGICWVPFQYLHKFNWWGNISTMNYSEKEEEMQRFVQKAKGQMQTVILV